MTRTWFQLIVVAVIILASILAWDLYLTATGAKVSQTFDLVPISQNLFKGVDEHLRADPDFSDFRIQ